MRGLSSERFLLDPYSASVVIEKVLLQTRFSIITSTFEKEKHSKRKLFHYYDQVRGSDDLRSSRALVEKKYSFAVVHVIIS